MFFPDFIFLEVTSLWESNYYVIIWDSVPYKLQSYL